MFAFKTVNRTLVTSTCPTLVPPVIGIIDDIGLTFINVEGLIYHNLKRVVRDEVSVVCIYCSDVHLQSSTNVELLLLVSLLDGSLRFGKNDPCI